MELLAAIGWPVLERIRLGPVAISPHGLGIAIGYLVGALVMTRLSRRRGMDEDQVGTILLWALIGAIFGARFFYVVGHFSEFQGFTDMLAIWRGGISLVGGIFGAIIFAYPFMRRYGYRFAQVMDPAAIGMAVGIIIGRIGDLIIGDHLGKHTEFFLGFQYRGGELPGYACSGEGAGLLCLAGRPGVADIAYGDVVHQTALYDFFLTIGLLLFLLWLNRRPRAEGVLISAFAIWYGLGRILTDFLRVDKTWPLGLTGSQWASVGVILLALVALFRISRRDREPAGTGGPEEPGPVADDEPGGDRPTTEFEPPAEPSRRSP
jgi:phosphatidylglycerol:prolipoprotein diacylglycerol transferase